MQTEILKLAGLTSENCIDTVTRALAKIDGVDEVTVSLLRSRAVVKFNARLTGVSDLVGALAGAGYAATAVAADDADEGGCCGGRCG
jgi:P-type Cu+ transporter